MIRDPCNERETDEMNSDIFIRDRWAKKERKILSDMRLEAND